MSEREQNLPDEEASYLKREKEDIEDAENLDDEAASDENTNISFAISSFGADYTTEILAQKVRSEEFYTPDFQRSYVWNKKQASKFIESLLLGLPVPGIFLYKESETNKYLIIDGQQRLKTLDYFIRQTFHDESSFRLIDVNQKWDAKKYDELEDNDKRQLNNAVIHSTIFRQDEPEKGDASVYLVFQRINSGGTLLSDQEIRACINYGPLIKLLGTLNGNKQWREIYRKEHKRLKDQELILRFLALWETRSEYKRPMKDFLNKYAKKYKNIDKEGQETRKRIFEETISNVFKFLDKKTVFRPKRALNAAVFDSVMIGIGKRAEQGKITNGNGIKKAYKSLLANEDFQEVYQKTTSDENYVRRRIELAINVFKDIE